MAIWLKDTHSQTHFLVGQLLKATLAMLRFTSKINQLANWLWISSVDTNGQQVYNYAISTDNIKLIKTFVFLYNINCKTIGFVRMLWFIKDIFLKNIYFDTFSWPDFKYILIANAWKNNITQCIFTRYKHDKI